MKRLRRIILNALTALSLLLGVATVVLWCRGPSIVDYFETPRLTVFASDGGLIVRPVDPLQPVKGWGVGTESFAFDDLSLSGWLASASRTNGGSFLGFTVVHDMPWFDRNMVVPWLVRVPDWAVFLATAAAPLAWAVRRLRPVWRHRQGRCRTCSYDLTGNVSGVCPECGTPLAKAAHAAPEGQ